MNTIKTLPLKAKTKLDEVVKEFGIDVIKEYVKDYHRQERRKQKKHNTMEEVAYEVYKLMYEDGYSRTRAIEKVADDRHVSPHTIRNHLQRFDKQAKENNFYTFGWILDNILAHSYDMSIKAHSFKSVIKKLANINNIDMVVIETYLYKYATLLPQNKAKYRVNLKKLKLTKQIEKIITQMNPGENFFESKN